MSDSKNNSISKKRIGDMVSEDESVACTKPVSKSMRDLIEKPGWEVAFTDSYFSKGDTLLTKNGVVEDHRDNMFNPHNKDVHVLPNFAERLTELAIQRGVPFFDDHYGKATTQPDRKPLKRSTEKAVVIKLGKMIGTSNDIFEVSEYQKLWDRQLAAHGFNADLCNYYSLDTLIHGTKVLLRDRLNEVFRAVVEEAQSAGFRKLVSRREQTANVRVKSVQNWLASAFDAHSRLLVLRIDFHFKKKLRPDLTPAQAKTWFQKFTKGLQERTKLAKGYVGYAGVLEYGLNSNYHIHAIFLYDAAVRNNAIHMASLLSDYWVERTDGLGYAFDCSRAKNAHSYMGIGEVHYTNESALHELFHVVVPYICKRDMFFRVLPGKSRGLMRSEIKTDVPKYERKVVGRPRESDAAPTLRRFVAPALPYGHLASVC
jgi:hypothetical protein